MTRSLQLCAGFTMLALPACGNEPPPAPPERASESEERALERASQMLDEEGAAPTIQKDPNR